MSKEKCFPISRSPEHCRSKTLRQLFFLHHSTFGVRYSAVLFRSFRRKGPEGSNRCESVTVCPSANLLNVRCC